MGYERLNPTINPLHLKHLVTFTMQILFVSECISFFKILKSSLSGHYPELQFVHYHKLEDYDPKNNAIRFSHLIVKLTDPEQQFKSLRNLRNESPHLISIALSTDKYHISDKVRQPVIDFLFQDEEIDQKLYFYFHQVLQKTKTTEKKSMVEIDNNCRKYVNLKSHLSKCLYLISLGLPAVEIAKQMYKSERSIEEYTVQLKKIFDVSTKKQLREVYISICKIDNIEMKLMA